MRSGAQTKAKACLEVKSVLTGGGGVVVVVVGGLGGGTAGVARSSYLPVNTVCVLLNSRQLDLFIFLA